MPSSCIIKKSDTIKPIQKSSFLQAPVVYCKKHDFYFLKARDKEMKKKCDEYYKKEYWRDFRGHEEQKHTLNTAIKILRWLGIDPLLHKWHHQVIKKYTKGKSLLDVGAGRGETLDYFSTKGYSVAGVEPDRSLVQNINKKFGKNVCVQGDAESFRLSKTFDVVYLCHVFEHLIRPDVFLKKIKKNIKKKGVLFLEVPNCAIKNMLNHSVEKHPHIYHFTPKSMKALLQSNNYEVLLLGEYGEQSRNKGVMLLKALFGLNNYGRRGNCVVPDKLIVVARPKDI